MKIKKLIVLNGSCDHIFQVGENEVVKIIRNERDAGAFIVFYDDKSKLKEVDVKSENILVYWG